MQRARRPLRAAGRAARQARRLEAAELFARPHPGPRSPIPSPGRGSSAHGELVDPALGLPKRPIVWDPPGRLPTSTSRRRPGDRDLAAVIDQAGRVLATTTALTTHRRL